MEERLLQPSLNQENYVEIKTYDIKKLFYVAFFGGIVPTIALGTKNCKWLRLNNEIITLLIVLGALVLISKDVLSAFITAQYLDINPRTARWIFRIIVLFFYFGYYFLLKNRFNQHIITGGELRPILKDAVIWSIIGIAVESTLIFGVVYIIKNVL